jgi:hypothetical protein
VAFGEKPFKSSQRAGEGLAFDKQKGLVGEEGGVHHGQLTGSLY